MVANTSPGIHQIICVHFIFSYLYKSKSIWLSRVARPAGINIASEMQNKTLNKCMVNQCENSDWVHLEKFQKVTSDHIVYG